MQDCGEMKSYDLQDGEKDEFIIFACNPQKKMSEESRQKILEIAKIMFEEDFGGND